jgi:tripartite-type tricarboxylate transporter receptor subunit TctC
MRRGPVCSLVLAVALLVAACSADVQTTANGQESSGGGASLQGETIELVVPYEPGGGYDTYARMLAPHLEKCLDATVVVQNEPGAGGLLASSKTFVASPDSLRTELMNASGLVSAELADAAGASFETSQFSWVGRVSAEPNVLVVASDSQYKSFDDLVQATKPVRFVATGPGSNEYVNSTVLPEVYGFPAETVTGFEGSEEARAAVLAGDADAHILPLDSQMDAIEAGDVRPLLVIDHQSHEALPDVPTVADFPVRPGQQANLDALIELAKAGRTLAGPPGMEPAHLSALRDALGCAVRDPELLAEARRQQRFVDPLTAEKTGHVVGDALDAPPQFVELVKQSP